MTLSSHDLDYSVRMDRQGVVHRWMLQSSLCDPDYHVTVVFATNKGFFREGQVPAITCLECIALEAARRGR